MAPPSNYYGPWFWLLVAIAVMVLFILLVVANVIKVG